MVHRDEKMQIRVSATCFVCVFIYFFPFFGLLELWMGVKSEWPTITAVTAFFVVADRSHIYTFIRFRSVLPRLLTSVYTWLHTLVHVRYVYMYMNCMNHHLMDGQKEAKIALLFWFQTGDSCASSLLITYKDENFTFSGNIPDPISLDITPTDIYEFSMYLTLADGYQMLYWTGRLDLTPLTTTTFTTSIISPSTGIYRVVLFSLQSTKRGYCVIFYESLWK